MDFFKALEEAKQHGIAQEDFVKIWELEMKLKQQKEESRILELKLAHAEIRNISQYQNIIDQVKSTSQDHLKELQKQICELKNDLAQQSSIQIQKMSEQFESLAAVSTLVIKNEVENILLQCGITANGGYFQNESNSCDGFQKPGVEQAENGIQKEFQQQTKPNQSHVPKNIGPQPVHSNTEGSHCIFPSDEGAILYLKDVDELITGTAVIESSFYILPDSPGRVRLSMWFNNVGTINARLSVFGVKGQYVKSSFIYTITGFIENKNSGSFSPLFEGMTPPLTKLRPKKEIQVNATVCLKTSKGSYENVTHEELEKRNFVINNCLIIKWFITAQEILSNIA